uniref:Trafficking protein particle complex subunit 6B n=1 Tax=Caenorhabditis tropicalis TaxID=1561998 RepID=A0A1I7U825_9PELO
MAFPFDILHSEIIRTALEGEKERCEAREKFGTIVENLNGPIDIDKYENLVQKAFLHANAETKLESIGYRVGRQLVEKVSKEAPKLVTELEIVKFICKDFWSSVFGKQVDNLRTNHQGVYVVQDGRFTTLRSFPEGDQYVKESGYFLAFPCGLLRGALAGLNIRAVVTPTIESVPSVKFHIQIQPK